uniref:Putative transmembrane protein n=1 Tax=Toxoplasma gondii TgCATBr9 TaxID=943120 RepID=A0A2T6ILT9_TOXGO|nr:putative transmembrane protein [Toxoplasma gondii TgCATBr9]
MLSISTASPFDPPSCLFGSSFPATRISSFPPISFSPSWDLCSFSLALALEKKREHGDKFIFSFPSLPNKEAALSGFTLVSSRLLFSLYACSVCLVSSSASFVFFVFFSGPLA